MTTTWSGTIADFKDIVHRAGEESKVVLLAVLPGQHVPQCRTPLQESVEALSRAFGSEAVSLVLDRVDALWLRLLCISAAEAAFGAFFIIDRKRMVMPDAKHWLDAATAAQLELGGGAADGDSSSKHFFEASALLDPNRPLLLWALRHVLACRRIDIDRQQRRRTTSLEVTQALCLQLESIARESFSALASPTAAPTPKLRRSYFSTASADTSVLSAPTNQSASCLQSGADACQTLLDAAASGAHQAPNPTEKQAASSAKAAPSAHRDIQLRAMIAAAVLDKAAAHVKAQDGLTSDPDAVQGPDQHQASETDADTLLRNAVRRLHLAVAAYPLVLDRLSAHQWSAYKAEAEASFGLVGAGATVAPGGRCNETATSAGGSSSSLQEAHEQHVEHPSTSDCRYVDQEYSVDMKLEPSQAAVSGSDAELLEAAMEEAADRMHELTGCCSVADRDGTADEHASDRDREEFRARLRHAPIAPPKHDDAFERVWARGRRWMDDAEAGWHVATDEADLMACMTFSALAKRTVILVVHRPMRLASREQDKQDFLQRAARDLDAAQSQSAAPAPLRLQWKLASVHDQTSAQQYLGTLPLTESIMLYLVEDGHIRTRNGLDLQAAVFAAMQQPDSADIARHVHELVQAACAPQPQSGTSGLFAEAQLADLVLLSGIVASDGAYECVPEARLAAVDRGERVRVLDGSEFRAVLRDFPQLRLWFRLLMSAHATPQDVIAVFDRDMARMCGLEQIRRVRVGRIVWHSGSIEADDAVEPFDASGGVDALLRQAQLSVSNPQSQTPCKPVHVRVHWSDDSISCHCLSRVSENEILYVNERIVDAICKLHAQPLSGSALPLVAESEWQCMSGRVRDFSKGVFSALAMSESNERGNFDNHEARAQARLREVSTVVAVKFAVQAGQGRFYFEVTIPAATGRIYAGLVRADHADFDGDESRTRLAVGQVWGGWSFDVNAQLAWDDGISSSWRRAKWEASNVLGVAVNAIERDVWFYWAGQRICRSFPWHLTDAFAVIPCISASAGCTFAVNTGARAFVFRPPALHAPLDCVLKQ